MSENALEQRPLGELFVDLAHQTGTLVKKEVELAKVELEAKATFAFWQVATMAVGAGAMALGALLVLAGLVILVGTMIPLWTSALAFGAVVIAVAAIVTIRAWLSLKNADFVPRTTAKTLADDGAWLKAEMEK